MSNSALPRSAFDDRGAVGPSMQASLHLAAPPARVAVIYGGPSPEHDVSILTGLQAVQGLVRASGNRQCALALLVKVG